MKNIWHEITYKGWYAIKLKPTQPKIIYKNNYKNADKSLEPSV